MVNRRKQARPVKRFIVDCDDEAPLHHDQEAHFYTDFCNSDSCINSNSSHNIHCSVAHSLNTNHHYSGVLEHDSSSVGQQSSSSSLSLSASASSSSSSASTPSSSSSSAASPSPSSAASVSTVRTISPLAKLDDHHHHLSFGHIPPSTSSTNSSLSSSSTSSSSSPSSLLSSYLFHSHSHSGINNNSNDTTSISPLKCLERYVKPKPTSNERQQSRPLKEHYSSTKTDSLNLYKSLRKSSSHSHSLTAPYLIPVKKENGLLASSKVESNALCELSQLVHKVGSIRTTMRSTGAGQLQSAEMNCVQSVFTCLQCSHSYETLDELVLHISTTKHFTRLATKPIEPIAPWEKGAIAAAAAAAAAVAATTTTSHKSDKGDKQRHLRHLPPPPPPSLECTLCGQIFDGNAEFHLRVKHKLDNFTDWISFIRISDASATKPDKSAFALNKLQTLINSVKK